MRWLRKFKKYRPLPIVSERVLPFILGFSKWLRGIVIATAILMAIIIACLLYIKQQDLPVSQISQSSQLVDRNGVLIDYFHTGVNRRAVSLNNVSEYAVQGTLAIEDKRFYSHFGFDVKGLARAMLVNIRSMSAKQGASTLTQQLARNLYLSHEKTIERKFKEAMYTAQLEMKYSKDEILEMYLNQIYYGHGAYGIEAASQLYFNKDASKLTLAESTMLVGIPKGPKYYSPFMNMKNAKNRQKLILQAMVDAGHITEDEASTAFQELLSLEPLSSTTLQTAASYFKDYVIETAIEQLGIDEQLLFEGGVTIYTTLDATMQEIAERKVQEGLLAESEQQAALIAIDPRNGHIKAMVGGKSYQQNQYNRALATTRQPGSTFKPFVYLTALKDHTLTATSTFMSEATTFTYDEGRKIYEPQNYAKKYANDYITMRKAIASSDNIFAVKSLMAIGAEEIINTAKAFGVTTPMEPVPSLALGTFPISPLEMASAYGVFANQGMYNKPISILKIIDKNGKILYEPTYEPQQVIKEDEAYVMTSLLEDVFEQGGTAHRVQHMIHRPVAGKSGTTSVDAWMIGYTPELSTAVWVGYDQNRLLTVAESYRAAPIFAQFMEDALQHVPPKMFPIPEDVVAVYIDEASGKLASEACPSTMIEYYLQGTEPTEFCDGANQDTTISNPVLESEKPQQEELPTYRNWWGHIKNWWTR